MPETKLDQTFVCVLCRKGGNKSVSENSSQHRRSGRTSTWRRQEQGPTTGSSFIMENQEKRLSGNKYHLNLDKVTGERKVWACLLGSLPRVQIPQDNGCMDGWTSARLHLWHVAFIQKHTNGFKQQNKL